jgi:hypothetical protein
VGRHQCSLYLQPAGTATTRLPSTTPGSQALVATEWSHTANGAGAGEACGGGPAEAEDEEAGLHTGHGQRRGDCRPRVHTKRANRQKLQTEGPKVLAKLRLPYDTRGQSIHPGEGRRFCVRGEREHDGCKNGLAVVQETRASTFSGQYAGLSGEHPYHKAWPLHVKVLARLGQLLPLVELADHTALLRLTSDHAIHKAGEPVGIVGAYMCVAHFMK